MVKKALVAVGIVLLVVLGVITLGIGGFPTLFEDEEQATDSFPTQTTSEDVASAGGTTTVADADQPFTMSIDDIEECGETCRDVTITLVNEQSTAADSVTVYTRIFAGNGTDGDEVWSGEESLGTLEAAQSVTATKRVELSLTEAYAVKQADGWITIQTTIQSETGTMTITERRDVL